MASCKPESDDSSSVGITVTEKQYWNGGLRDEWREYRNSLCGRVRSRR